MLKKLYARKTKINNKVKAPIIMEKKTPPYTTKGVGAEGGVKERITNPVVNQGSPRGLVVGIAARTAIFQEIALKTKTNKERIKGVNNNNDKIGLARGDKTIIAKTNSNPIKIPD